jgi:hypothetical protein
LIFPLAAFRSQVPVPSLGGGQVRYKPLIPIEVTGPSGKETRRVLVDTGADDTVFSFDLAIRLGVNLTGATQGHASGVGSQRSVPLHYAPVILQLQAQTEVQRWPAVVAFTRAPLRFPLLGIAGGLEHFRTTVDVGRREVELIAGPSLPSALTPLP